MRALPTLTLILVLAGCGIWLPADPGQVPDGPIQPRQGVPRPIGPIVELGRGQIAGVGWRYAAYQSNDGPCLILETASGSSSSCGPLDMEVSVFAGLGVSHGEVMTIDGAVADHVAAVMIETADGRRFPARLLSLQPAGIDGQVLLAMLPGDVPLRAALAIDAQDQLIEAHDLSWAMP
jgi:hypothetical protein